MTAGTLSIRARRMRFWARALVLIAMVSAPASLTAQQAPVTLGELIAQKTAAFEKTIGKGARIGVSVVDLASGDTLASARPNELFIPASNQKLLTSAFAMHTLGGDYQFSTELYITRRGDMVVYGDYDPTLGDPELAAADGKSIYAEMDRWAAAVKKHLGDKPPGKIYLSGGSGVYRPSSWKTRQNHLHYQAPAGRLNFHRNCFSAIFKIAGGVPRAIIKPQSRYIAVRGAVSLGAKQVWSMRPEAEDSEIRLRGTIKRASPYPQYVAANHPPMLFGRTLAERLIAGGVPFDGAIKSMDLSRVDRKGAKPVCTTTTPLARAMKRANKDSLNLAAECFLLRCGDGVWASSARVMEKTLTKAYDLSHDSLVVSDGSGLSRKNLVSPATMTKLLVGIAGRKHASVFTDSLARAGVDGTLSKRMVAACKGRIIGKTGYILQVSCLSGYVLDKSGKPAMTFSIMANDMPGRVAPAKALQDEICAILVKQVDGE